MVCSLGPRASPRQNTAVHNLRTHPGPTESKSSFQQDPRGIYIVEITSEAQDGVAPAQSVASANRNVNNICVPADALLDQKHSLPSQPVSRLTLGSILTSLFLLTANRVDQVAPVNQIVSIFLFLALYSLQKLPAFWSILQYSRWRVSASWSV